MSATCTTCTTTEWKTGGRTHVVRIGRFWRKSDGRWVQRLRCRTCGRGFSRATHHPNYRQNKRHLNRRLRELLCSGVSQRRAARYLRVSRTTIARKFRFLALRASLRPKVVPQRTCHVIEFDDLETFEHSRYRPISVTVAIEAHTRRIIDFELAFMTYKKTLPDRAKAKYGTNRDERHRARSALFDRLRTTLSPTTVFKSDDNPHYPATVRAYFPRATHLTFTGRRAGHVGQGELKGAGFDPLFSLNHTFAMCRANMNRLFRRTWCTTKKIEALRAHLVLYADYHNSVLLR